MKRFKCRVFREDEYIIEFDENIWNEERMEEFRDSFYNFDELEEHAEHISQLRARVENNFFEGYGDITIETQSGWEQLGEDTGIKIIIKSEDQDCYVDVEEIE